MSEITYSKIGFKVTLVKNIYADDICLHLFSLPLVCVVGRHILFVTVDCTPVCPSEKQVSAVKI